MDRNGPILLTSFEGKSTEKITVMRGKGHGTPRLREVTEGEIKELSREIIRF